MISGRHVAAFAALCGSAGLLSGCGSGGTTDPDVDPDPSPGKDDKTTAMTTEATTTTTTTTMESVFNCSSNRQMEKGVVAADRKGFCVDDTTFDECADEFLGIWPHSEARVTSYRLFAAWKPEWKGDRMEKWKSLKAMLDRTNSKVLLGAEIQRGRNCDEQFQWALEFMKVLGKERVAAFAFGNEIDYHGGPPTDYWGMIERYSKQIDEAGFEDVPLTAVFSQQIISKLKGGFYRGLAQKMHNKFGKRWIWAFNTYSLWDSNLHPNNQQECDPKTDYAVGIKYVKDMAKAFRDQVTGLVGNDDWKLWITETGWSAPVVSPNHDWIRGNCPKWGADDSLYTLYENVAAWDLTMDVEDGKKEVDQLFYFAMRDHYFMGAEAFGLVKHCGDKACKVDGKEVQLRNTSELIV